MENLNYFELINKRESCRDFAETEVESEKLQSLGDSFALCDALDEDINTELHVIDRERGAKLQADSVIAVIQLPSDSGKKEQPRVENLLRMRLVFAEKTRYNSSI